MSGGLPKGLTVIENDNNQYELKARFATMRSLRNANIWSHLIGIPLFIFAAVGGISVLDKFQKQGQPFQGFLAFLFFVVPCAIFISIMQAVFRKIAKETVRIYIDKTGMRIPGHNFSANEPWRPRVVPLWEEEQRKREGKSKLKIEVPMVEVIIDSGPGFARRASVTEIIAPDAVEAAQRLIGAMADLMQRAQAGPRARTAYQTTAKALPVPVTDRGRQVAEFAPGILLFECADGFDLRSKLPTIGSEQLAFLMSALASIFALFVIFYKVVAGTGGVQAWAILVAGVVFTWKCARLYFENLFKSSATMRFTQNGIWIKTGLLSRTRFLSASEEWAARVVPDWNYEQRRSRGSSAMPPVLDVILDAGPGLVRRINVAQIRAANATDLAERYVAAIAHVVGLMENSSTGVRAAPALTGQLGDHDDW